MRELVVINAECSMTEARAASQQFSVTEHT
jgi:hypothetical protein